MCKDAEEISIEKDDYKFLATYNFVLLTMPLIDRL